jgi:predicted nucleic acid-binding protein
VIADTNFLIDLLREQKHGRPGPASQFLNRHRSFELATTIVTVGELAVGYQNVEEARRFFSRIPLFRLGVDAAYEASRVDRELRKVGQRLGENDNWIAGIARYHGETLISNDKAFHRVSGLKVVNY